MKLSDKTKLFSKSASRTDRLPTYYHQQQQIVVVVNVAHGYRDPKVDRGDTFAIVSIFESNCVRKCSVFERVR